MFLLILWIALKSFYWDAFQPQLTALLYSLQKLLSNRSVCFDLRLFKLKQALYPVKERCYQEKASAMSYAGTALPPRRPINTHTVQPIHSLAVIEGTIKTIILNWHADGLTDPGFAGMLIDHLNCNLADCKIDSCSCGGGATIISPFPKMSY